MPAEAATPRPPAHSAQHGMFDWRTWTSRPWWPAAKRWVMVLFFLAVMALVVNQARQVEWSAVMGSLRAYPLCTLLSAAGLAVCSYAIYSGYDLIARWYLGTRVQTLQVMLTGFIAYAFNLSLGAWIGAIALRYRLYARLGVSAEVTTRIVGFSLLTNWLGYFLLAGVVFTFRPLALPPSWELGSDGLRLLGAFLLLLTAVYIGLCCFSQRRSWHIRGHGFELPRGRIALVQLVSATANWMLASAIVCLLLQGKVDYASTLCVMLLASLAGLVARVPAGLGVLEAVCVALLSHRVPQNELLAALLCYRAIYQLAPLALAALLLLVVDARAKAAAAPALPPR